MQFKRINIKNFLSVGEIEFNFNYNSGITLIKGRNNDVSDNASNASGKSILQDAIFFALFGKTLRKINQDEIVHRKIKKNCRVELEFDNFKIIRTLKPNSLTFYVDGKEVSTDASVAESKKILENYLSINYETLCNILCFGQNNLISFFDCTEGTRREIVENLMNLREYNLYEEKTKELFKELKNGIKNETEKFNITEQHFKKQEILLKEQFDKYQLWKNTLEAEIIQLESEISKSPCINDIEKAWNDYNQFIAKKIEKDNSLKQLTIQKLQLNEKIQELVNFKNNKLKETVPLQEKITQLKDSWIKKQEEKEKKLQQNSLIKEEILKIDKEKSNLNIQQSLINEFNIAKSKVEENKEILNRVKNKTLNEGDVCPSCFGPIKIENRENYVKHIEKHLSDYIKELEKFQKQIDSEKEQLELKKNEFNLKQKKLQSEIDEKQQQIEKEYTSIYNDLKSEAQEIKNKINDIEKEAEENFTNDVKVYNDELKEIELEINSLNQNKLKEINKPSITLEELKTLEINLNELKNKIKDRKKTLETNPFNSVIFDLETSVKEASMEASIVQNKITDLEKDVPYYEFWLNAFGKNGIKAFVVDQIIPVLNKQISYWMGLLYDNNILVEFDKYLNVAIENKASDYSLSFFGGSGGEKRRMDLAVMLAFRQIMKLASGKDPNIVFFDEAVEHLDENGINSFYETIKDLSQSCHVYIITHNPYLLELLKEEKFITFEKEKGITKLIRK